MENLTCEIKLQKSIKELARNRPSFDFLEQKIPISSMASSWNRGNITSKDIQVIAIGQSGYGKSTTLNILIGENVFETNHTHGCTRVMQSAEFRFPSNKEHYYFSLADLPGIGENPELDKEYIELYRNAFRKAHVVIYFLKADQRSHSIDEWAFFQLFPTSTEKSKVIIALNAIDKVEPLNRLRPLVLTKEQQNNIVLKISDICGIFGLERKNVVPISALENIDTDTLVNRLGVFLAPYMRENLE